MIDHLVYATPHLGESVRHVTEQLGIAPSLGGRHPGRGTMNYLLSLGDGSYLEIIGPDREQRPETGPKQRPEAGPQQTPEAGPRSFGIDALHEPRLVTWATPVPDIEERVRAARAAGYDLGPVRPGSRELPDGTVLRWRTVAIDGNPISPVVPFLIDWGDSPHPSTTAPRGARLVSFRAVSARADEVRAALRVLQVDLELDTGDREALIAEIEGPAGRITL